MIFYNLDHAQFSAICLRRRRRPFNSQLNYSPISLLFNYSYVSYEYKVTNSNTHTHTRHIVQRGEGQTARWGRGGAEPANDKFPASGSTTSTFSFVLDFISSE